MPNSTPRGRPRRADVDTRLAGATLDLLRDGGPAAVTMEAVAARAGVAKTTLYRRFDDRAALLTRVLTDAVGGPDPEVEGPVMDRVRTTLERVWHQMSDVLGPGGLAAIMTDSDPAFTGLFRAVLRPYDDALVAQIEHDAADGLLRADVDADGVVSLFLGAYLGELVRRGRVDDDWLDRTLEMLGRVLVDEP